jgi:hypothetical protein
VIVYAWYCLRLLVEDYHRGKRHRRKIEEMERELRVRRMERDADVEHYPWGPLGD